MASRTPSPGRSFRHSQNRSSRYSPPFIGGSPARRTPPRHITFDSDDEKDDLQIPSVNERLGHLRPSRELLEYYRKKIADFDGEHEEMLNKLEQYKMTYEQQHKSHWELRQREEEIAELQKALSDMQVYLFQEREHVLRLYSENDRLKIMELEDRKKIHHLLALTGATENEVTYFHKEPPSKAIVAQRHPAKKYPHSPEESHAYGLKTHGSKKDSNIEKAARRAKGKASSPESAAQFTRDNETLMLQVEALQAQLEEQTKLSKEQVDGLLEDRRVRIDEMQTVMDRDQDKIQTLKDKLHKTQDLLYDSTKDYLELKYENRANERRWMAEKDRLLQELDKAKEQLNISTDDVLHITENVWEQRQAQADEINVLENQLQQSHKMTEMYREQVIKLEDELSRIKEQDDVSKEIFKERSEKMGKRLALMNQRYEALETRRNLEVEGFKTDIKNLRVRLKEVERQLYRVTVGISEGDDVAMLQDIKRTARRSKMIQGELHQLKAKIYGIENDLRHL
ncbi:coiled-coil domain containing 77-like [Saccoglossus kowalevskii]|uniref:Coiled-coil domain containing 77-like n=1 Tax=Saccoglossus kowalevskii TaxID=10224 RepID=A0ABM0GGW4_SACKO|nr:coiled-coil domain containing 77-like [Saccoglossus kowalevskii]